MSTKNIYEFPYLNQNFHYTESTKRFILPWIQIMFSSPSLTWIFLDTILCFLSNIDQTCLFSHWSCPIKLWWGFKVPLRLELLSYYWITSIYNQLHECELKPPHFLNLPLDPGSQDPNVLWILRITDPEFPYQIWNFHIVSRISISDPKISYQIQNFQIRSGVSLPNPEFHISCSISKSDLSPGPVFGRIILFQF